MNCRKNFTPTAVRPSPREAVGYSDYFLNVLAGRKTAVDPRQLTTDAGWLAFNKVRRRVQTRFSRTRIIRAATPTRDSTEVVAMVVHGNACQAMTFTFRITMNGWRLDHCDLLEANRLTRKRP